MNFSNLLKVLSIIFTYHRNGARYLNPFIWYKFLGYKREANTICTSQIYILRVHRGEYSEEKFTFLRRILLTVRDKKNCQEQKVLREIRGIFNQIRSEIGTNITPRM